jgi:hypothetical protein
MDIKQFGLGLDMIVETDLSPMEFRNEFVKWIESNGWCCGGGIFPVDENGYKIKGEPKLCTLRKSTQI